MNNLTESIYKKSRKRAGLKREPVAEELHIDVRTLDKYEACDCRVPEDIVDKMCRLYGDGFLAVEHILESPLGKYFPAVVRSDMKGAALSVACELDDVAPLISRIFRISSDGKVNADEQLEWNRISKEIKELTVALMQITFAAEASMSEEDA